MNSSRATLTGELFNFNRWANVALVDFCAGLEDEQLDLTAPGTGGSIRHLLLHIAGAETRYLQRLLGRELEDSISERTEWPGLPRLREYFEQIGEQMEAAAAAADPARIIRVTYEGHQTEVRAGTFLVQSIHHANDHRTQICTILGTAGLATPELSGWGYSNLGD